MKKIINLLSAGICLSLLITSTQVWAGTVPNVEKTKTYTKTYPITGSEKISVNNQFGEVKINAWSKNEVKVDVTIIAKSSTDERAQEILDRISIEDGKKGDGVYFKTNMKNENKTKQEGKNYKDEKMEINYQVYMPTSNPLSLMNQFGPSIVPDMNGAVELSSKFGTLTTGKLSNVKKVNVEFGSATIESISGGSLDIKFSRAIINKLDGTVTATFEHCSGIKLVIENGTKELTVASAFTTLYLDVTKNLSANFDINTSFGGLSNKTDFDIKEESGHEGKKGNFNHSYSGKTGGGNSLMKISSSFSQITLGHNLAMNIKEENKDKKEKKKTTSS